MYVARLQIEGFRGVRSAEVLLSRHSVLVGANNAGKTTIVDALNLVLGRGDLRRRLTEYDFYGGTPRPSDRVNVRAVVTGFATDDPAAYPDVFNMEKGGTPVWWDNSQQELLTEEGDGRSLAVEVGFCARFDDELLEEEYLLYFVDGDSDPFLDDHVKRVGREFRRALGLFLVPARRTWEGIWSFRSALFRKVVASQVALPGNAIRSLRDSLRAPDARLEAEGSFADIVARLNQELDAFLRPDRSDIRFRVTPGDTPGVMDAIVPHIRARGGFHLPLGHHGSGVVSLQTLLLLMEFGRRRQEESENFVLVAEEPELHLHPGHHRRLVARMRGVADQTVVTTHSPQVASFFKPQEIVSVHCDEDGNLSARPLVSGGEEPDTNALIRLFTLYRASVCEAVMAEVVVVPEGKTDYQWLSGLALESVTAEGWDPDAIDQAPPPLGVLPTQDSHVGPTFAALSEAVPRMVPMLDGDSAGDRYRKELQALESPPLEVVVLRQGWTVEDLVAWVLCADSSRFSEVVDALAPEDVEPSTLGATLRGDALKTRWDRHELLARLVGQSAARATAARTFLRGIGDVGMGRAPGGSWFRVDEPRSTEGTRVWVFDPEME